ncbi:MAG: hypothetical protein KGL90_00260 [Burkholderiales bacterium]|nr:hypothetical protein [Burkholderiales bacterium]
MNARHFFSPIKTLGVMGLLALAGAAHAGNVYWSVGVNAPVVGAVVSNAPHYYDAGPSYYYAPPPVIVQQPVVVARPYPFYGVAPVMYAPAPRWEPPRREWGERRHHHHDHDDWHDDDDDRGNWGRRDR